MRRRFRSGKAPDAKHGHVVRILRLTTVLLYGLIDTGAAIYQRHISNKLQSATSAAKTGYVAHLSGALAGFLIGIIVLKNRRVEKWERKMKLICIFVFVILMILAMVWNAVGDYVVTLVKGNVTNYFPNDGEFIDPDCHYYI